MDSSNSKPATKEVMEEIITPQNASQAQGIIKMPTAKATPDCAIPYEDCKEVTEEIITPQNVSQAQAIITAPTVCPEGYMLDGRGKMRQIDF